MAPPDDAIGSTLFQREGSPGTLQDGMPEAARWMRHAHGSLEHDAGVPVTHVPSLGYDFSALSTYPPTSVSTARPPGDHQGSAIHPTTPERGVLDLLQRDEGQPLEPATRERMEPRFEYDFANIRVHADSDAAQVVDSADAQALTVGSDIVFNPGAYPPRSRNDHSVLAHELAHVVQNESANGDAPRAVRSAAGDAAEVDARHAARAAVNGERAQVRAAPGSLIAADPKTDETTPEDAHQADAEDWQFAHSDVDFGATAKEKSGLRKGLAQHPASAEGREQALASEGTGALPKMSLYDTTRAEGGRQVKEFEKAYAVFRLPMEMAMGSLGRVQDLLTAGAPQVPSEMSHAAQQVFHPLKGDRTGSQQKIDFGVWGQHGAGLHKELDHYMAVFKQLEGALAGWRGAKELILRKQKQAQLAHDKKKLEQLEAPAKLIVGLMEVFEGAVSAYEKFGPESGPEHEPDVDLAQAESEVDIDVHTGLQKTQSGAAKAKGFAGKVAGTVGGHTGLTRESIINWALGRSDEIEGLEAHIAQLKADIAEAGEKAEDFQIEAAASQLKGVSRENRVAAASVGTERTKARESAADFAGVMGGENVDTRLITLYAEAYQELATFGKEALDSYHPVAATLPAVQKFVNQPGHRNEIEIVRQHRRAAQEAGDIETEAGYADNDYESLMEAAGSVRTYGALLAKEYPQWRHRADAWSAFFLKETGSRLDEYGAQRAKAE